MDGCLCRRHSACADDLGTVLDEQVIVPAFFNMVRWQNHRHVMRHSVAYFHDDFAGRLAAKVAQSGQSLGDFLMSLLQVIWLFLIYVTGALFLFGGLDLSLVAVLLCWCVLYTAMLATFIPRIRRTARALAEASAGVNGRLVDTYSNIMLVKLDGGASREDAFIGEAMAHMVRTVRRYTRNITGARFAMQAINAVMVVAIGYVSLILWQQGAISIGGVAFALGLVIRLSILATRMLGQFNSIFRAIGNIQNAMETITRPVTMVDEPDAVALPPVRGAITFDDVSFRYRSETRAGRTVNAALDGEPQPIIDHVSLHIAPGERVGLIGPSGAGKTTLVRLLLRLYDVQSGTIRIDGTDIKSVTQVSLRQNIGMVMQETALMNRSIRDNIAYARPEAGEDDILDAARKARADIFIEALEDGKGRRGYDAHVGERGVKLSGGQRQRIALARVLLKNAPILVLDEATSALDSETESVIQESLDRLMQAKTVIAIAHRLSTIAAMDRLIVLDQGRIVEEGSHEELVRAGGTYARLWARQSGRFLTPPRREIAAE